MSQHVLAIVYEADRQVQKAVELLKPVVAIKANCLQDNYPSRLMLVGALANTYTELAVNSNEA
jgi:hypothetical protein